MIAEYVYVGDQLLAMIKPGESAYYFHNDHLGTPQVLTDENGNVAWKAVCMPFGGAQILVESVENPFRFPGQYYDQETGLHYNYFRYYNPTSGRYITPDPIGLAGGINLFTYVANNPVNNIDPRGLQTNTLHWLQVWPLISEGLWSAAKGIAIGVSGTAIAITAGVTIIFYPSEIAEEPPTTTGTLVPSEAYMPAPDLTGTPESCNLILQACLALGDRTCQSTGSRVWWKTKCWIAYLGCMLGNL